MRLIKTAPFDNHALPPHANIIAIRDLLVMFSRLRPGPDPLGTFCLSICRVARESLHSPLTITALWPFSARRLPSSVEQTQWSRPSCDSARARASVARARASCACNSLCACVMPV